MLERVMEAVRISVRVAPGSARTAVVGPYRDGWKLNVRPAPERGQANDAVVRLLAEVLALPARQIEIVAGQSGRDKLVAIEGATIDAVNDALARASESSR
ncbi:MAG TPA: DUF167 domain-containing protein [Gaiellaceae bacterium]|jgi:hypothetical protein|nr:DUF167 domain-containing protein [Gaiellaceae bacterium]